MNIKLIFPNPMYTDTNNMDWNYNENVRSPQAPCHMRVCGAFYIHEQIFFGAINGGAVIDGTGRN